MGFNVGDNVLCIQNYQNENVSGMIGSIIGISDKNIGVQFLKPIYEGHACVFSFAHANGLNGHCWVFPARRSENFLIKIKTNMRALL